MHIFRRIFLSNYWWQESDICSQASYRYAILWKAFLDPSDSYFLYADFVDFYTHWTYMRIFLSNYWWQKSDIWSQASYRYPISWEAFFDLSNSYFLLAEERGYHRWALAHSSSCSNFGWPDYLFYLQKLPDPPSPTESIGCPKTNQEINEPSYEMVGVKITVTNYGQNKLYFWHFLSCWFFIFFSDNSKCFRRNGFEMYILMIIYTVCTCDTLVQMRILNSEISWFCFDFHKWGPVSFIITDFNVFVQFFE